MDPIIAKKTVVLSPSGRRQAPPKQWHGYLTLDMFLKVANKTFLHPFVMWMVPLSLKAQMTPSSHLSYQISVAYAIFLTVWSVLVAFNRRLANGIPREVDLSEEVVVITGGSGGLGRLIADFYAMRGTSVAVLDIKDLSAEAASGVSFYQCDVGDPEQIQRVAETIRKELGPPTILINNAAVLNSKPLMELTASEVETSFKVNLLSHFHTIREFLPGMLQEDRGTIVTVASVLGTTGCALLSDYTAAKAALSAMHTSLKAELAYSKHPSADNIRTVLVSPGQVATPLFAGMKTPSNFLAPVVEPVELAKDIVEMINSGWSGEIHAPYYANWIQILPVLPVSLQRLVRSLSGLDKAMLNFAEHKAGK